MVDAGQSDDIDILRALFAVPTHRAANCISALTCPGEEKEMGRLSQLMQRPLEHAKALSTLSFDFS